MSVLAFSTTASRQMPTARVTGLLAAYRLFCAGLTRGPDAVQLRLRLAEVFLAAHPDLTVWMTRPLDARLADLRRCKAWPLICFAVVTGRLRCDVDLLMAKKLGGLGRCAEDEYPGDFAVLREAAARLSWGRQFTEQVVRQALVAAIAFTGRAPHELIIADLDELDAAVDASPHISATQRFTHHKQTHGVRQLLYEARIVHTPAPTRGEATSNATKLAHAVSAPEILRTMTAYLKNRSTQLRPGTLAGMANDLACFGEFLTTHHPDIARLTELTRAHIEQFSILARTRTYRGHRANDHLIGPAAAAHTMITLRCFLDDITAWDWADAPARRLVFASDIPRQPRPLPRALPADTDAALMAAVAQHPDPFARNGLTIIRGTGLRIGELLDLELDCVVDYGTTGSWLRVPLGKLATERAVPLDEATLAALDALAHHRGPQRSLPHPRYARDADFMFAEGGRRIHGERLRRGLRQAAQSAGLTGTGGHPLKVVPHQLRHTYATTLVNAGMSLPALMALLGHQTPEMTLRYATLASPTLRSAYDTAMGKMRRQFTLTPTGRPIVPDKITWLHAEMLKTRVAHGYCSRDLAAEACPYANICENCDNYVPGAEFAAVLQAQLVDVEALHDDAAERGWDGETARHARVAANLTAHLENIDPQPST
jgi:integrase